jgi:surface antigen
LVEKVNIKARIDRHSRMLKENIGFRTRITWVLRRNRLWYKIVIIFMAFLMPIYPMFASKIHKNTEIDFYRWYIDEDSILGSYVLWDDEKFQEDTEQLYEAKDSFLSVSTVLDDNRDLSWTNEIVKYKVQPWESISSIAAKFRISSNSIYWANNYKKGHVIHPWEIIKIPPVSGIIYKVKSGDTLASISKKYKVDISKIRKQNLIWTWETVKVWDELVLPGAVKYVPKPKYTKPKKTYAYRKSWYKFASSTKYVNKQWTYKLTPKPSYHKFYRWNCTRYVAKYKTVDWWGNAKNWLYNARKKWHPTWYTPRLWAIIVFNWRWYNPRYGHVWIVMDIKSNWDLIVSDMNYRRLWEVTYRRISSKDRAIRGYIYVE